MSPSAGFRLPLTVTPCPETITDVDLIEIINAGRPGFRILFDGVEYPAVSDNIAHPVEVIAEAGYSIVKVEFIVKKVDITHVPDADDEPVD